ncbi:hypothetical protein SDC9_111274 [bioreactor metagenome]|uniref:Uncharacterized protein n=1 Tax=bioreactor metagenome TaxID=1076179 RepID=A0A645BH03_9ZZZZ
MHFTHLSKRHLAVFFIDFVIFGVELAHQLGHLHIPFGIFRRRPRNYERSTRLIDENVIHLIHNGKVMTSLYPFFQRHGQVIA